MDTTDAATNALEEIAAYLQSVPAWYLATDEDGQPHVRPFSFAAVEAGRLWFCTADTKDVYEELHANPRFEACAWRPGSGWLILRGKAAFAQPSFALRQAASDHLNGLGESYEGADDPRLACFYLAEGTVVRQDIDGSKELVYESGPAS